MRSLRLLMAGAALLLGPAALGQAAVRGVSLSGQQTIDGPKTFSATLTAGAGLTLTGGVLLLTDGAVGAPSLSFTGDTNSGLYRIGADSVGIAAGGVGVLRAATVAGVPELSSPGGMVFINDSDHVCIGNGVGDQCDGALYLTRVLPGAYQKTVADSGNGSPAADTLGMVSNTVYVTCNDADGCDITLDESGAFSGFQMVVVNASANAVNFADTAGVSETSGALSLGTYDSVVFAYIIDRWVQVSAVQNN